MNFTLAKCDLWQLASVESGRAGGRGTFPRLWRLEWSRRWTRGRWTAEVAGTAAVPWPGAPARVSCILSVTAAAAAAAGTKLSELHNGDAGQQDETDSVICKSIAVLAGTCHERDIWGVLGE